MNVFFLVNKPHWISSFDVIRIMRKKLGIRKMWHTGTLDPLATWALLVATGNYTKLIPYLEKAKKTYVTTISLDGTSSSYDLWEEVKYLSIEEQEVYKKTLSRENIEERIAKDFSWEIDQMPPKFSAVKVNWKRAYELAREWKEVEIASKKVHIHSVEVLDYEYPLLTLELEVSAGTYIRSIARDLWSLLNTWWYLTSLTRTKIEGLHLPDAQDLDWLTDWEYIDVKKVFWKNRFIEKDQWSESYWKWMLSWEDIKRIDNGLERIRKFNLEIWKHYFLYNWIEVLYVVEYDGEKLFPIRKI